MRGWLRWVLVVLIVPMNVLLCANGSVRFSLIYIPFTLGLIIYVPLSTFKQTQIYRDYNTKTQRKWCLLRIKLTYLNAHLVSRQGCNMLGPDNIGVSNAFNNLTQGRDFF